MLTEELRYALRTLLRNPGFTAIATLSLALGIGANSAIFSLADALLLRPMPVPEPSSVVSISTDKPDDVGGMSYPDYRDFRTHTHAFEGLAAFHNMALSVAKSAGENPHLRAALTVSDNFFRVLKVQPILGRGFGEQDSTARNPVAVISYDFWRSEFSADPSILGRTIRINGIDFSVSGVTPEAFPGVDQYVRPDVYIPATLIQRLTASPKDLTEDRSALNFEVKGRLKSGVTREQAQGELSSIWKGLASLHSDADQHRNVAVRTELQIRVAFDPPDAYLISLLMTLVAVVLMIACANVANLLLGRARGRTREIAIRLALGVSRARLIRQLLSESLLLAIIGAIGGLALAYGGIRFFQNIRIPTDLPISITPRLDARVLIFSLISALVSAIIFGLTPALRASKPELVPALKNAETGSSSKQRLTGRNALVIAQVAMSMVLLIATGMLIDGFRRTMVLNPGFRTDHVLMMQFDTSLVRYSQAQAHDFYRDLVERAREQADIRGVALASTIPMAPQQDSDNLVPEGYQFPKGQLSASVLTDTVDENYFPVMRTPIVRGRAFTANDKDGAPRVAIVNEQFAKQYWPNQDPIGKRLRIEDKKDEWMQVIGVAKTGKYTFVGEPPTAFVYMPFAQNPRKSMVLFAETYGDPAAAISPLREVVHTLDANQPIFNVRTMENFYQLRAISITRMIVQVVASMGGAGLALALIGLYGLVAYSVAQRTREIGVRMAIGAARSDVLKMVMRQGLILAVAGIAAGGLISIAVSRALTAGLIGLGSPNPATYVLVPIVLLVVTLASCYVPAFRASRVDPMVALRYE
jgi:predicted permease